MLTRVAMGSSQSARCSRLPHRPITGIKGAKSIRVGRVWHENHDIYGARKVWLQLKREGHEVARCTVRRLMRDLGLHGAVRDRQFKTTLGDHDLPKPPDHVNRDFRVTRPSALRVSDLIYVATWRGLVYVAFVIAEALTPIRRNTTARGMRRRSVPQ
jgi:transposase InsO family protein